MTWAGFWLPNLINATVFTVLATAVGLLARRWLKQFASVEWMRPLLTQIFGEQQETKALASTAATNALAARQHAKAADEQSQTAVVNATSQQTERALIYLAEQLGDALAALQRMAGEKDEMFTALLHAQALLETQQRRMEQYVATHDIRQNHQQEAHE